MPFTILIEKAMEARKMAYAPYSNFKVGAAVQGKNGKIWIGCNVENSSYGLTCCAERNAIFKAVSDNELEFEAIAIVADRDTLTAPCGACRQVILEFGDEIKIISANLNGDWKEYKITDLVPFAFRGDFLRRDK